MRHKIRLATLAFAGSAVLIAGCGGSSSGASGGSGSNNSSVSPSAELLNAVSALGDASTLTSTLKLDATSSDIMDLASQSGGSHLTSQQADAIAGAQLAVEISAPSGKKLSDISGGNSSGSAVDVTFSDNGTNWVSLRFVNKTLYVQTDLKDLLNAFGKGATYAQLQASGAQLPSFLQALIAGKWVSLPESELTGLTGSSTQSTPNPQQRQAFINGLKDLLTKDVSVTRTATGSTDKLALSANTRTLAEGFLNDIATAVPQAGAALSQASPSQVPSRTITMSAEVTGGALSQLAIDFGQFDPQHQGHLPVELDFAQGGASITAPSGAVAVNTQELAQLFGSFAGGLG